MATASRQQRQMPPITKAVTINRWAERTLPPLERLMPLTLQMPKASPNTRPNTVVTRVRSKGLRGVRNGTGGVLIRRSCGRGGWKEQSLMSRW